MQAKPLTAAQIMQLRKLLGLSRRELAEHAGSGVREVDVWRVEHIDGDHVISPEKKLAVLEALMYISQEHCQLICGGQHV